jgi:glutathione peroxidase
MTTAIADIPFLVMDGTSTTLGAFRGRVLLLVNVASKCGLTPQYATLETLFMQRRDAGLTLIAFPANNFGAQEPGSNDEIAGFCSLNYGVSFPLAQKVSVKGEDQHPLYAALTAALPTAVDTHDGAMTTKLAGYGFTRESTAEVLWNFEKFLIGRDGVPVARFNPDVAPNDPLLLAAIERELAK